MDKKVTIKYFLNEDISPAVYYIDVNKRLSLYPVYVRVTYNRKSTRFKFLPSVHVELGSDVEEYFSKKGIYYLIERNNNLINRVIDFEVGMYSENFSLNGFGSRYYFYSEQLLKYVIQNDRGFIELSELVKKRKLHTLFGRNADNPLIQLSLALGILGREELIKRFSGLLKKWIFLSLTLYLEPNRHLNLHDWLLTNIKDKLKSYIHSFDEKKAKELSLLESNIDNIFNLLVPDRKHELEYHRDDLQQLEKAALLLGDTFSAISQVDIERIANSISNFLWLEQTKLYKLSSTPPTNPPLIL